MNNTGVERANWAEEQHTGATYNRENNTLIAGWQVCHL